MSANQQLYEAVATLHGWWYDSELYYKYVQAGHDIQAAASLSQSTNSSDIS